MFFFEKKNQKTFTHFAQEIILSSKAQMGKSLFASFSPEKEGLSLSIPPPRLP